MDLGIDTIEGGEKTIIKLNGEIDVYTAPKLKNVLIPLTKQEGQYIEICFDQVNYMDSTGLGVFIHALKSTKKYNSQMKLVHLKDRVLRLFTITGLTELIEINSGGRTN